MHKHRHDLFQQMAQALTHQQNGHAALTLAYWENVLRLLPDDIPIQNHILEDCRRVVHAQEAEVDTNRTFHRKLDTLVQHYQRTFFDDDREAHAQQIYLAMCQQCGGNPSLALIYWNNVLDVETADSLVITFAVQDFCWLAHQELLSKRAERCIDMYRHLLRTFPEFLEGYLNLSLILYKYGLLDDVVPLLSQIPHIYKDEFIVIRYFDLFRKITEVLRQFAQVPFAAIEDIVNDLTVENTFYPALHASYFEEMVEEIILREKRFFEKRRKALEEKALAQTNKQLIAEGIALGQRVTMAKQANSDEIQHYLYDNHIRIAEVLLNNPNITADDVLIMAQLSHVSSILSLISTHRKWGTLHDIRMAVLCNPQTLPADSLRLLKMIRLNDLANVFHKKNLPTELRIYAKKQIQDVFLSLSLPEKIGVIEATSGEIFKLLERAPSHVSSFLINLLGRFYRKNDILVNICRWKQTPADVLRFIGRNGQLTADIRIKFALLSNPKTPKEIQQALLDAIPERDIRYLLSNAYLPSTVKHSISLQFPHLLF
ncbi:hypothetical protein CSA56_01570 [candidate division KSB3 bacterium]|uniref:Uncharacterized protein n=1 Tax=candidate division KSB3 bacterium TaxID=2044937 RepID=A0A2G6KKZ9_9BACT|nr:MAG: hypothetical protein CSA56_01570 [candidate division KSB3 bacterium]